MYQDIVRESITKLKHLPGRHDQKSHGMRGGAGRREDNLKRWFGNSVVVNDDGTPKVLYHGTPGGGFTEFDPERTPDVNLAFGKGIYMSESSDAASGYVKPGASWGNDSETPAGMSVYPLYAKIEHPFYLDDEYELALARDLLGDDDEWVNGIEAENAFSGGSWDEDISNLEQERWELESRTDADDVDPADYDFGTDDVDYQQAVRDSLAYDMRSIDTRIKRIEAVRDRAYEDWKKTKPMVSAWDIYEHLYKSFSDYTDAQNESSLFGGDASYFEFKSRANDLLREFGVDGLVHLDHYNPGRRGTAHRVWIAFDPKQVKSASGNTGTFSLDTADITKERLKNVPGRHNQESHGFRGGIGVYDSYDEMVNSNPTHKRLLDEKKFTTGYFVTPNNKLVSVYDSDSDISMGHGSFADKNFNNPDFVDAFSLQGVSSENFRGEQDIVESIVNKGAVQVRNVKNTTNLTTAIMDDKTLRRLQRLERDGKLKLYPDGFVYWGIPKQSFVLEFAYPYADFIDARSVKDLKNKAVSGYRELTEKAIPFDEYQEPLRTILKTFNTEVNALFDRLVADDINLDKWQLEMQKMLARHNAASYMMGAGTDKLTQEDLKGILAYIREQYDYLDNFVLAMRNDAEMWASMPDDERLNFLPARYQPQFGQPAAPKNLFLERYRWRAGMYSQSPTREYWAGTMRENPLPLPALPTEGSACKTRCKCHWSIVWLDKKNQSADAYWILGKSEHCQQCLERSERWNPLRIRDGQLILPNEQVLTDALIDEQTAANSPAVRVSRPSVGRVIKEWFERRKNVPGRHNQRSHGNRGGEDKYKCDLNVMSGFYGLPLDGEWPEFVTAYHLTPAENIKTILENGLEARPVQAVNFGNDRVNAVYLFSSKFDAHDKNIRQFLFGDKKDIAVTKVVIPRIDFAKLREDGLFNMSVVCSDGSYPQAIQYIDNIPANWIGETKERFKHLPGRHEQKTHGDRGITGQTRKLNPSVFKKVDIAEGRIESNDGIDTSGMTQELLNRKYGNFWIAPDNNMYDVSSHGESAHAYVKENKLTDSLDKPPQRTMVEDEGFIRISIQGVGTGIELPSPVNRSFRRVRDLVNSGKLILPEGSKLYIHGLPIAYNKYLKITLDEFRGSEGAVVRHGGDGYNIELKELTLKHLPGKHNQRRHGWRYGEGALMPSDTTRSEYIEYSKRVVMRVGRAQKYQEMQKRVAQQRAEFIKKQGELDVRRANIAMRKAILDKDAEDWGKNRLSVVNKLKAEHVREHKAYDDIQAANSEEDRNAARARVKKSEENTRKLEDQLGVIDDSYADISSRRVELQSAAAGLDSEQINLGINSEYIRSRDADQALATGRDIARRIRAQMVSEFVDPIVRQEEMRVLSYREAELAVRRGEIQKNTGSIDALYSDSEYKNVRLEQRLISTLKKRTEMPADYKHIADEVIAAEKAVHEDTIRDPKLTDRMVDAYQALDDYFVGRDKRAGEMLHQDTNGGFVDDVVVMADDKHGNIGTGISEFEKMTGSNPTMTAGSKVSIGMSDQANPAIGRTEIKSGKRGRSYASNGHVYLGDYVNKGVVVHELGHVLESKDPLINRLVQEFYNRRTFGNILQKLNDVLSSTSYDESEVTKTDKFLHAYMGKWYNGLYSEILSMGLEMFLSDPIRLAREDPDYFDFVYSVVRLGNVPGVTFKHLPGQHNQKTHGWRYTSPIKWTPGKFTGAEDEKYENRWWKGGNDPKSMHRKLVGVIHKLHPGFSDDVALELASVMALDRDRFINYAKKYGIPFTDVMIDRYFRQDHELTRIRLEKQWNSEKQLAFHGEIIQGASEKVEDETSGMVGADAGEAASELYQRFGVEAHIESDVDRASAHENISRLINVAEQYPAIRQVMGKKNGLRTVNIKYKSEYGAAATAEGETINTFGLGGHKKESITSGIWIHELGHVMEQFTAPPFTGLMDTKRSGLFSLFGYQKEKGRKFASMYRQMTASEDFAEWFTAIVGGANDLKALRDWDRKKFDWMMDNIPGLKDLL